MEAEFNHLNHATWECKYHVVFTPKYRKKLLFGKIKRHLGQVFHDLARRKECRTATVSPAFRPCNKACRLIPLTLVARAS